MVTTEDEDSNTVRGKEEIGLCGDGVRSRPKYEVKGEGAGGVMMWESDRL